MIIKNGLDQEDEDEGMEEESDSDSGLGASVPPCSVIFIGANVSTGKSSIKLRPRDKKVCTVHRDCCKKNAKIYLLTVGILFMLEARYSGVAKVLTHCLFIGAKLPQ